MTIMSILKHLEGQREWVTHILRSHRYSNFFLRGLFDFFNSIELTFPAGVGHVSILGVNKVGWLREPPGSVQQMCKLGLGQKWQQVILGLELTHPAEKGRKDPLSSAQISSHYCRCLLVTSPVTCHPCWSVLWPPPFNPEDPALPLSRNQFLPQCIWVSHISLQWYCIMTKPTHSQEKCWSDVDLPHTIMFPIGALCA